MLVVDAIPLSHTRYFWMLLFFVGGCAVCGSSQHSTGATVLGVSGVVAPAVLLLSLSSSRVFVSSRYRPSGLRLASIERNYLFMFRDSFQR